MFFHFNLNDKMELMFKIYSCLRCYLQPIPFGLQLGCKNFLFLGVLDAQALAFLEAEHYLKKSDFSLSQPISTSKECHHIASFLSLNHVVFSYHHLRLLQTKNSCNLNDYRSLYVIKYLITSL